MKSLLPALALAALACEPQPDAPDPSPARAADPASSVETWIPEEHECGECHDAIAEQWAGSRHHAAYTNPDFARSYAREQLEFCRNCHAPALARGVEDSVAEARGVGCLDCHLRGDSLVSGEREAASEAPHALTRDPDFAVESCARCHEFAFPDESWRPAGTMMQLTMSEHAASDFADRSCADCHMPDHDHGFASTRDDAAMRRALRVDARPVASGRGRSEVELELTPVGVGHAFPTGDLHRRLELHAELVAASGEVLASATRYLGRHFPARRHRDGRYNYAARLPTPDDRPRGPTTVRLELEPPVDASGAGAELRWWVDLERVDHRDNHDPSQSTIASEVRLAEGAITRR